jgi:hypothetical protein
MDVKERFHFRGNINVDNLLEIYNQNELDWDSFEFRQQTFVCFADTKTLPIMTKLFNLKKKK